MTRLPLAAMVKTSDCTSLGVVEAVGYLAARIVDAVFIAVMVFFVLLQIPLAART